MMMYGHEVKRKAVHKLFWEALRNGNLNIIDDLYSKDCIYQTNLHPYNGIGWLKIKWPASELLNGIAELEYEIEDICAEGDTVVVQVNISGLHANSFLGAPPTGQAIKFTGIHIFKFAQEKIKEHRVHTNIYALFCDLGLISPINIFA
jgi:steroid delta-isomerase-like uncharacterized protein